MSAITEFAREKSCTVRLLGCRNDVATSVLAHAPSVDKSMGRKSPDWWGMIACSHCHRIIDRPDLHSSIMAKEIREAIMDAVFETQKLLFRFGLLTVSTPSRRDRQLVEKLGNDRR